jgi:hypothetical protein
VGIQGNERCRGGPGKALFNLKPKEKEADMRLLATTLELSLLAGHTYAASMAEEAGTYHWGKRLYCSGELIITNVMHLKVNIDTGDLRLVEVNGATCKFISARDLEPGVPIAYKGARGKIVFYEFFDNAGTAWYRWEYRNK